MNDAEYIFNQTSRERKRNGYGDYHKKRQGGRQVRLPSDHYTKKELAKLSSDVTKINLNAPVCWAEFKTWPDDLKIEYIQKLENKFHATSEIIASMMGVSREALTKLRHSLGAASKRGGKRPPLDVIGWSEFCGAPVITAPDPEPVVEKSPESSKVPVEKSPERVQLDKTSIMNLAILIDSLKGSGAKLTFEVIL